jgi:hypothetical protein
LFQVDWHAFCSRCEIIKKTALSNCSLHPYENAFTKPAMLPSKQSTVMSWGSTDYNESDTRRRVME